MSADKDDFVDDEDDFSFDDKPAPEREPRSSVIVPATILAILVALIGAGAIAFIFTNELAQSPADKVPPKLASEMTKPAPASIPTPTPAPKAEQKPVAPLPEKAEAKPKTPPVAPVNQETTPGKTVAADPAPAPAVTKPEMQTARRPPVAPIPPRPPALAPAITPKKPDMPKIRKSPPLARAPDPSLVARTERGPLPVVGGDGREAWRVYARPFNNADKRPKFSVVIYGLGTSAAATNAAIQGLPGAVTLAFSPYAKNLPDWLAATRAAGHEALMMVPMEPINYPDFDPGPQALITSLSDRQNVDRLNWILSRATGYVGVTDYMGSRFTASSDHMRLFLKTLSKRGLLFLESRTGASELAGAIAGRLNVPFAANTLYLDSRASRPAIDGQLREAVRLAKTHGSVIVMGFAYPVTLERVASWATSVEKRGLVLSPVSAIAQRQK